MIFGSTTLLRWLLTFLPGLCREKSECEPKWGENCFFFQKVLETEGEGLSNFVNLTFCSTILTTVMDSCLVYDHIAEERINVVQNGVKIIRFFFKKS